MDKVLLFTTSLYTLGVCIKNNLIIRFHVPATTGESTQGLLDGWPTVNAYIDTTAISIGYAIQSGVVLQKNGNYWIRIGTAQAVDSSLVNRSEADIVPIGTISKLAGNCSLGGFSRPTTGQFWSGLTNCSYNVATNLYYGTCSATDAFCRPTASSNCASLGMRLPSRSETAAGVIGGIPSCSSLFTWTSDSYLWWNSSALYTSDSCGSNSDGDFYKCVVSP